MDIHSISPIVTILLKNGTPKILHGKGIEGQEMIKLNFYIFIISFILLNLFYSVCIA